MLDNYLYFIVHFIFTSNDKFFKNKYNPIIFITIRNDVLDFHILYINY